MNMKLPPFWPADPEVWGAQVKAQFSTRVQRTKFNYIVASLMPELTMEVRDLILHPPAESPYDLLKQQLTTASEQQQLISTEDLGDHKPSHRLQQLLGDRSTTFDPGNSSSNVYPATLGWCLPPQPTQYRPVSRLRR